MPRVDFDLLRLHETLYEERSVVRTAERLHLTPSAVSHALNRLRRLVGDELFVRKGGVMEPTPRSHELARRLRDLLPQLQDALGAPTFDPAAPHTFTIAATPSMLLTFLPRVVAVLREEAPGAEFKLERFMRSAVDDLDSGRLDLAISNVETVPPQLSMQPLITNTYVWTASARICREGESLSAERLAIIPRVDVRIESAGGQVSAPSSMRRGVGWLVQNPIAAIPHAEAGALADRRVIRHQTPDAFTAMALASEIGGICLVPDSVARRHAKSLGCVIVDAPSSGMLLRLHLLTHIEFAQRPATRWLVGHVKRLATIFSADDPI